MGLPVRPRVAEEPPALAPRRAVCQSAGVSARIDVTTSRQSTSVPGALSHLAAQAAEQTDGGRRPRVERRRPIEVRRRLRGEAVGLGQEPATRDRVDPALLVGVAERERDVAHRQARADEKHVLAAVELERVARPWVARVTDAREHRAVPDGGSEGG